MVAPPTGKTVDAGTEVRLVCARCHDNVPGDVETWLGTVTFREPKRGHLLRTVGRLTDNERAVWDSLAVVPGQEMPRIGAMNREPAIVLRPDGPGVVLPCHRCGAVGEIAPLRLLTECRLAVRAGHRTVLFTSSGDVRQPFRPIDR